MIPIKLFVKYVRIWLIQTVMWGTWKNIFQIKGNSQLNSQSQIDDDELIGLYPSAILVVCQGTSYFEFWLSSFIESIIRSRIIFLFRYFVQLKMQFGVEKVSLSNRIFSKLTKTAKYSKHFLRRWNLYNWFDIK